MKNDEIISRLELENESIWSLIRGIHEGEISDLAEIKKELIRITGSLNTELLIPLQRLEGS